MKKVNKSKQDILPTIKAKMSKNQSRRDILVTKLEEMLVGIRLLESQFKEETGFKEWRAIEISIKQSIDFLKPKDTFNKYTGDYRYSRFI